MAFYGVVDGKVEMTASVIGQGDPGYSSTSKMITESALYCSTIAMICQAASIPQHHPWEQN